MKDVLVKNIRARVQGGGEGFLQGFDEKSMLSGVTFTDVYMHANKTPAATLEELNMLNTTFSEDIQFLNTK